jgi:NADH-ubiquinone oxidoreductase chain 1
LIGALRCVAQTISYEVRLALILITFVFLTRRYASKNFMIYQNYAWFMILIFPLAVRWFIRRLAETNRSPFDFAEGESELVSGFNIEYSSGGFAILFMAEYARILFMRCLIVLVTIGRFTSRILFFLKFGLIIYLFILVRGTLPRFRYDKLMNLAWKLILPGVLLVIVFVLNLIGIF